MGAEGGRDGLITRREFVAGSALLVAGTALGAAGCGIREGSTPAGPSSGPIWVPVSTAGLVVGEPRWVEFDLPSAAGSASASRSPAAPSGTPADSLTSNRGGAWLVLQADSTVVAFNPRCTHRQCLYDWESPAHQFRCRCHPGLFAIDGTVVGGPPPRPLDRLETRAAGAGLVEIGWVNPA